MSNDNHEKSLEEINQEIEEELRNYNPKEDEEKNKVSFSQNLVY
ncbi:hypothetical protein [Staphylococcus carnosus]|nr:hypothetical protein [Staphylococcus carnosus]GEP79624.1 hypothetical protein SCA05_14170 [Staphylococcus carnosus]SUM04856.1 Uncharacterised protein [Staphylococcus carnosus]